MIFRVAHALTRRSRIDREWRVKQPGSFKLDDLLYGFTLGCLMAGQLRVDF